MDREYIKIKKPFLLPDSRIHQKVLNDDIWKSLIFYHLLTFYKNYNLIELKQIIEKEKVKIKSDIEDIVAIYIRNYIRKDRMFCLHGFKVFGGINNDSTTKGLYDISFIHSYWDKEFHFECKNLCLDPKKNLINKYVFYPMTPRKKDGGVYRYFNGKYAQNQNFGGMIGFVLEGDVQILKNKIIDKLSTKFDTSPDGDLKQIIDNSIENNNFTFNSIHFRNTTDFILHHLLFDFYE